MKTPYNTVKKSIAKRSIKKNILKKIKGYGLIEILLSTVILGVGLVGIAQFQGNVYKDGSLSKQRAEALKLAEKNLEELRHFSTVSEYQNNITSSLTDIKTAQNIVSGDTTTFTVNTYISPDSTGKRANLSVKVTWPDLTEDGNISANTTVQLSTAISNTTPNNLAMTSIAPAPETAELPIITIEIINPTDTEEDSDNSDACTCGTINDDTEIFTANANRGDKCDACCSSIDSNNNDDSDNDDGSSDSDDSNNDSDDGSSDNDDSSSDSDDGSSDNDDSSSDSDDGSSDGNDDGENTTTVYGLCGYVKESITILGTTTVTWRTRGLMKKWTED